LVPSRDYQAPLPSFNFDLVGTSTLNRSALNFSAGLFPFLLPTMKTMLLASLVIWCIFTVNALPTINSSVVKFYPRENGLDWPLPDFSNPASIFMHVVHCKHVLKMRNTTDMDKAYIQHCQQTMKPVKELLRAGTLDISQTACTTLSDQYYQLRAKLDGHSFYDVFTSPILPYGTSTLRKSVGYNYGKLLMREYYADSNNPLTDKERQYLDSWFKPEIINQSAIAYICQERHGIKPYEMADESHFKSQGKEQTSRYTGYWQVSTYPWCPPCKCDLKASGSAPTENVIQLNVVESSCKVADRCYCQGVSGTLLGVVSGSQFSGHFGNSSCSGPVQPNQITLTCNTPNPSIMVFILA